MRNYLKILAASLLCVVCCGAGAESGQLKVGSKRFTESYVLAEIVAQTARSTHEAAVVHKPGLGNTAILFAALQSGAIDLYPEYSGTIVHELLGGRTGATLEEINRALRPMGLAAGVPLGFSNTYALAVAETVSARLSLERLSELRLRPDLRIGLSQEFLNRRDGWPALKSEYSLPFSPQGLDHGLAYDALAAGQVDVIDIYTTDAKISRYSLRVLTDDRGFFPRYEALLLYRADLPQRLPAIWAALTALENRIAPSRMIALNAQVELDGVSFAAAAQSFISGAPVIPAKTAPRFIERLLGDDFLRITREHLLLVFGALILSCAAGIPLGIWAARVPTAHAIILPAVGVLQTIPALALLAMLIALLDRIGTMPAIIALFIYGLLPIVRNTATGLADVSHGLRQAGAALGLQGFAILRLIELPLAASTILAGVRTSAVINVGTATIAAFIGAGGYGERIVAGLAVNDRNMLLAGALPAAVLAILIEVFFNLCERRLIPAGLRLRRRN